MQFVNNGDSESLALRLDGKQCCKCYDAAFNAAQYQDWSTSAGCVSQVSESVFHHLLYSLVISGLTHQTFVCSMLNWLFKQFGRRSCPVRGNLALSWHMPSPPEDTRSVLTTALMNPSVARLA